MHEKIEGNKNKRSSYLIRAVNCSCSKIPIMIKVIKMISIIIVIIIIETIMIIVIVIMIIITIVVVIIKWRSRSRTLTTTNTELPVTYNDPKAPNITKSSTSDAAWENLTLLISELIGTSGYSLFLNHDFISFL